MNEKVSLDTFPSNRFEALALLYCQKHATSETSPAELARMYHAALKEIKESFSLIKSEARR